MSTEEIHEALAPIAWLAGRWVTEEGKGQYTHLKDFQYHEVLEFICVGQPMFNYTSTSKHPESMKPMHQERGFLRIKPGTNDLAFIVSHNFGLTSLEEGSVDSVKKEITLATANLAAMSFSKPPHVKKFSRIIRLLQPNVLEVELYMETDSTPLSKHLHAIYRKD
ncbi:peroxynitrite isomerase THAP4-like [Melitaea cinxia]|uniref:peroxynitrite isomerase THAP4-like n=1 Tax=Melitaea cinxia TaxID=113334 RepID=UPI001E272AAF|nr:peroxynitrite isomerase THAP4-like [Melitaea cinxia]